MQMWEKILIANVMRWPLGVCTQEKRYDQPLMSPSGLVTLDLCVVSGTGHLSWLPLCQIPCRVVCLPWSLSFPLHSFGWLQLFTLLGSLK